MTARLSNRARVLGVLIALVAGAVLLGPWGEVGVGDARLYQSVSKCANAPSGQGLKACTYATPTGPLLPTAAMGGLGRVLDAGPDGLQRLIRGFAALLAVLITWLIFRMASGATSTRSGVVAVLLFMTMTPFLERARAGGPELWSLALLLSLARLMSVKAPSRQRTVAIWLVSAMLVATHPFAAPVLVGLLFTGMFSNRGIGFLKEGRVRIGWADASLFVSSLGGLALFALTWPGARANSFLWHRVSDLARAHHPPLRIGDTSWVQGIEAAGPPWWTSASIMLLSLGLPFLVLVCSGVGARLGKIDREDQRDHTSLAILLVMWSLVCVLQGSPFADGQDHRLILAGLMAPWLGAGFRVLESLANGPATWLRGRIPQSIAQRVHLARDLALFAALLPAVISLPAVLSGRTVRSSFANSAVSQTRAGVSPFHRPSLTPGLLNVLQDLPGSPAVACSPWQNHCLKDLLPGAQDIGLIPATIKPSRLYRADLVIIPIDPTYSTPTALIQSWSSPTRIIADVREDGRTSFAIRSLKPEKADKHSDDPIRRP